MMLYHGSTEIVEHPNVELSRPRLDFGPGFYLTSLKSQAERWALRKSQFEEKPALVNVYSLGDMAGQRILRFPENDAAWVEFVCARRRGEPMDEPFDIIVGGVADDKVYEAVNMYFRGFWDMETTLSALSFFDENDQYCFVTQSAVDASLAFEYAYEVENEGN